MSPLCVSIPLAGFNLSGGVKSLCGVANALAARGHRVRLLVPDYASRPPIELDPAVAVRVLSAGAPSLPVPARKLLHLLRLATTATAGADICLANYFTTAYAALSSKLLRGDRCVLVYNVRGYEPVSHGLQAAASFPSRLVRSALAWGSYRLPLRQIVTTEWLRQQTGDHGAYVVGHGIDLNIFRPPDRVRDEIDADTALVDGGRSGAAGPRAASLRGEDARRSVVVGTIARESEVKGYPDFLRAMPLLAADLPIRFRIARPDPVPLPEHFPVEVSQPRIEPEMASFYAGCDVFVFSSRAEGFGLPALEAMATGCAVVTTDCGGVNAFARAGQNCVMVAPANPHALANAITTVVADFGLRARLSRGGVATAQQFGRAAVLDRFCVYLECLASSTSSKFRSRWRLRARRSHTAATRTACEGE